MFDSKEEMFLEKKNCCDVPISIVCSQFSIKYASESAKCMT